MLGWCHNIIKKKANNTRFWHCLDQIMYAPYWWGCWEIRHSRNSCSDCHINSVFLPKLHGYMYLPAMLTMQCLHTRRFLKTTFKVWIDLFTLIFDSNSISLTPFSQELDFDTHFRTILVFLTSHFRLKLFQFHVFVNSLGIFTGVLFLLIHNDKPCVKHHFIWWDIHAYGYY